MNQIHRIKRRINEPMEPFTSLGMIREVIPSGLEDPILEQLCVDKQGAQFWLKVVEIPETLLDLPVDFVPEPIVEEAHFESVQDPSEGVVEVTEPVRFEEMTKVDEDEERSESIPDTDVGEKDAD